MQTTITMDKMMPGQLAIVKQVNVSGDMRRRFLDIGLIKNTKIECVGKSPSGDPSAYFIRGAVIAIRAENCSNIEVLLWEGDEVDA